MLLSVLINCPDDATADAIAEALLARRLIACANRQAQISSVYVWEGRIERRRETPLLVKTVADRFDAVAEVARSLHPFETPAIVAHPIARATPDYAAWVAREADGAKEL